MSTNTHTSETDLERCRAGLRRISHTSDNEADAAHARSQDILARQEGDWSAHAYSEMAGAEYHRKLAQTARELADFPGPASNFAAHVIRCAVNRAHVTDSPRKRGELAAFNEAARLLDPAYR